MARKPLIEPGSMLPSPADSATGNSLVDRVIARDREKSGRAIPTVPIASDSTQSLPPPPDTDPPNIDPPNTPDKNITSNAESNISAHITTQKETKEGTQTVSSAYERADENDGSKEGSPANPQEDIPDAEKPAGRRHPQTRPRSGAVGVKPGATAAWKTAQQLADTTPIPITLRLAEGLNDYLDEQAHRHRKAKVKKQDLVSLAVRLLVAELESGTDLAELLERGRGGERR